MVTVRRTSKRLARRASTSTPARSRTVRPIPATSAPVPVIPAPIPVTSAPIPVNFGANPASSANPMQSQVVPPLNNHDNFVFDGIQYSPYFLNSGDNPGASIISEILDGTNYNTWNMAITNALDAKNKLAFVDGSLPRPSEIHTHYRIWSRCNAMVKSWILNSVTKEIYGSILRFKDASEIWNDLMVRFHITNLPRSYQITQQIWSLHQGSMNLSTYYTKLKTLWDDLDGADCVKTCQNCTCCRTISTHSEHTKIIKFLAGLNESYSSARSQIIMKKNVPTLAEVYNLLDQDYSQRSINPVQPASAFHVAAPELSSTSSNVVSINAAYNGQKSNRPICSHCGYNGHTKDTCYKIHGYPIGFKHKGKQPTTNTSTKPVVAQLALTESNVNDTISIGQPFTPQPPALSQDQIQGVIAYFNSQLATPLDQTMMPSTSGGLITALPGMAFSSSTLHFVGILRATGNTLSSKSMIIDSGATHHVSHDKSLFVSMSDTYTDKSVTLPTGPDVKIAGIGQDPIKGLTIGSGEQISNLYVLDRDSITVQSDGSMPFSVNVVVDTTLWHNRLGHPSMAKIESITNVLGIKQSNTNKGVHCSICPLAKQKHLPYISHNNMSENAFDLLHIDIWGPFSVPTTEGYRYFLTIVDDNSRVTWIYLLKTKSEVLKVFPDFLKMIETQYKAVVKGVRSDNAPELQFTELYRSKGIQSYHSCPETPEQNSVVERKHQHILNVARSLMFQAHLPLEHWGDCVLTAVFLINRLPTPLLKNKSPFQVLTNKKPEYKGLRVLGCLCYSSTSSKTRHKFQPRAKACLFLGYPAGYKGYKLLDLETHTIHISRNVVFHEDIFPFATGMSTPPDFFSILDSALVNGQTIDSTNSTEVEDSSRIVDNAIDVSATNANDSQVLDKGKRISKPPAYLHDYFVNMTATDIPHPLAAYMSYERLTDDYKAYICAVTQFAEPSSFHQAKKFDEWVKAMNEELIALESTHTWSIVSLPQNKRPIGCKWVYKTKLNADGSLERYKARLVAKGYTQQEGVDFVDTFSPVAKMTTVKTLLAVAAAKKWSLHQLDISNAFLNGDLDEEIYMTLPPGYTAKPGDTLPPNAVCKLHKSLYGLKQASRQWFLKFSSVLMKLGFQKSHTDHTLFVRNINGKYVAVLVYVDDIIITANDDDTVSTLKLDLQKAFKLRDLGTLQYFLGLEIARSAKGISICQRKYILELLEETKLLACKPSSVPMDPNVKLVLDSDEPVIDDPQLYRRLVGRMMYLTITRPDITYAVNRLCQFTSAPKQSHLKAAYRVLHYLKGSIGLGLFYSSDSDMVLKAFTDADWGSCKDSRRSTTGYCMFLGNSLISWKSKKQPTVSMSSAESEYRAMGFSVKEVIWLVNLLHELQVPQSKSVALFCDSTAAIHIANNAVFHERTKHLELDCHKVRECVTSGLVKTLHVTTDQQIADVFTKPLYPGQFHVLIGKMALISIYMPS
ncbi:Retrotransposon Copia-like N-terminal [Arabidopsis suecica]|uniref:Retrotransposon Copia-like N-terminal n=1 Tax=Arabidopsis suecica TaxID=45249 RepID=A0A8T2CI59_ARASU|nr:Retrotransposon Copia-like N-terminal [Arabidopsis suecica]